MAKKPILYYTERSAPCRAAMLCAAEIGIDLELREINMYTGENLTPEFLKINPQHTIPTLDDNGIILTDSHVICSYLADKYSKDENLYPKDFIKRLDVQTKMHYDSGHLFARIRYLHEYILYLGVKGIDKEKVSYIQKTYEVLENFLKTQPFVCGNHLTIADLCFIASLSSVTDDAPINAKTYPKLTEWMAKMEQLPYYDKANRVGAEVLQKMVKDKSFPQ